MKYKAKLIARESVYIDNDTCQPIPANELPSETARMIDAMNCHAKYSWVELYSVACLIEANTKNALGEIAWQKDAELKLGGNIEVFITPKN